MVWTTFNLKFSLLIICNAIGNIPLLFIRLKIVPKRDDRIA